MSVRFLWNSAPHVSIPLRWFSTRNLYAWALPIFLVGFVILVNLVLKLIS